MQLRPDAPVPEDPMVLIQSLFGIIYALQAEVAELRARLSKDSHNSSKPPSSDGLEKKPVSLRKACGRKPGGQKGHAGHTLEFVLPNTVIEHSPPDYCDACGASLGGCEASLSNVDRSLISRRSSWGGEHRVSAVTCTCGKVHRGAFPTDVSAPVYYGPSLKAASVYLTQWQLLPVRRSTDVLGHLFGMPVSPHHSDRGHRAGEPSSHPGGRSHQTGYPGLESALLRRKRAACQWTVKLAAQRGNDEPDLVGPPSKTRSGGDGHIRHSAQLYGNCGA